MSPVAYGHWHGGAMPATVARLRERMKSRPGDVDYTFARLVQEMTSADPDGNLSYGVWNANHVLTAADSHGDAGVVVIDLTGGGFKCRCEGGYLETGPDGMPRVKGTPTLTVLDGGAS
ncbi:MAG TPA: hypothetical protein VF841_17550 [Anaeromyxobacter sp.]